MTQAVTGEGSFFRIDELPARDMMPGVRLRSVEVGSLMMTFVEYAEGAVVPTHFHPSEQITYVTEGCIEVQVGGTQRLLGPGEGVRIPANTEHSSRPIDGPATAVDAWTPGPAHFRVAADETLGHHVPIEGESIV